MAEDDNTEALADATGERVMPTAFIDRVPQVLLRPDRRVSVAAPVIGLAIGIGAGLLCFKLSPPGGMLSKTFDPNTSHALIPYAIFCMFFWGIMICLSRWHRLRALAQVSRPELLARAVVRLEGDDGVETLRGALQYDACTASPLLRRMSVILQQWQLSPGLQDAEVVLANQVALDADASHRGYALVRVMIWALPVLGLIGTVLGIADAVGGFANFLGKDINEVSEIRVKLVEVTGGLSFAFLITLQGLLTSLIAMLLTSMLQSSEERLLARIQRGIVEEFLPVLQRVAPPPVGTSDGAEGWIEQLRADAQAAVRAIARAADQAVHQIATAGDACLAAIRTASEDSTTAVQTVAERAADSIAATAQESAAHMTQTADACTTAVQTVAGRAAGSIAATAQESAAHMTRTADACTTAVQAVAERAAGSIGATAQESATHMTQTADACLAAVGAAAQHCIAEIGETGASTLGTIRSERDAHAREIEILLRKASEFLTSLAGGLQSGMAAQAAAVTQARETANKVAETVARTTAIQASLADALQRSEALHAGGTLDALRAAIDGLNPILTRFQQPFVLQAVPASRGGG